MRAQKEVRITVEKTCIILENTRVVISRLLVEVWMLKMLMVRLKEK